MSRQKLTTREVAEYLGVSKRTVIRYANRFAWCRHRFHDAQGRENTRYDLREVLRDVSPAGREAVAGGKGAGHSVTAEDGTVPAGNQALSVAPVTVTGDNMAHHLAQAIGVALAADRRARGQERRRFALVVSLFVAAIVWGGQNWLRAERQAQVRRDRQAQAQTAALVQMARAQERALEIARQDQVAAQAQAQEQADQVTAMRDELTLARADLAAMKGESGHKNQLRDLWRWFAENAFPGP